MVSPGPEMERSKYKEMKGEMENTETLVVWNQGTYTIKCGTQKQGKKKSTYSK